MRGYTPLSDLVGLDDPLDPSEMRYTTKAAKTCRTCIFYGQRSSVCKEASRLAVLSELADCESDVVYVPIPIDSRQLTIE